MKRLMRPILVIAALAVSGCPTEPEYVEPPASPFDYAIFPSVGDSKLLADVTEARLEFDPTVRDAITALGSCVDAATYCYAPGTSKTLEWCLENTRSCATDTPWTERPCCPRSCKDQFTAEVKLGTDPAAALEDVFFVKKTCFPGVKAALEGTP